MKNNNCNKLFIVMFCFINCFVFLLSLFLTYNSIKNYLINTSLSITIVLDLLIVFSVIKLLKTKKISYGLKDLILLFLIIFFLCTVALIYFINLQNLSYGPKNLLGFNTTLALYYYKFALIPFGFFDIYTILCVYKNNK